MGLYKRKRYMGFWILCAVLACEIALAADLITAWNGKSLSVSVFGGLVLGLTLAIRFLMRQKRSGFVRGMLISHGVLAVAAAALVLGWFHFRDNSVYRAVDSGKEAVYSGRRVMLIVPHQDDDINVLGGVLEEYAAYGSDVYPVFVTNGDNDSDPEIRFRETLAVFDYIGIPRENVYFLGYGDQWSEGGPHLYNGEPGVILESAAGKRETYSTAAAAVYREGRSYTSDHLLEDLQALILEIRPEVIFCSDYDSHIDHKAVTLSFEKVMGRILKETAAYRPLVFKGYAYKTAWYAEPDYYETNILSTRNVFGEPHWQRPEVYRWEDRVRLPVGAQTLARSVFAGGTYHTLSLYASQDAALQAGGVINGDKVFWQRNTASLCYRAEVTVSSNASDAALLNDFMLLENHNLVDAAHLPVDGAWIPEEGDSKKQVTVTLEGETPLHSIILYDNPSETDNVRNATILLDDGTLLQAGPLHPGGAATEILLEGKTVRSFTVNLLETEGEWAGLTEIEAYGEEPLQTMTFVKLMDRNGDFAYDYWMDPSGKETFGLYAYGAAPQLSAEDYSVCWDNPACRVSFAEEGLSVECPGGEETVVTVSLKDSGISDSILVRNPGKPERLIGRVYQQLEETVFQGYCSGCHWNSAAYKLLDLARDLAEKLPG